MDASQQGQQPWSRPDEVRLLGGLRSQVSQNSDRSSTTLRPRYAQTFRRSGQSAIQPSTSANETVTVTNDVTVTESVTETITVTEINTATVTVTETVTITVEVTVTVTAPP